MRLPGSPRPWTTTSALPPGWRWFSTWSGRPTLRLMPETPTGRRPPTPPCAIWPARWASHWPATTKQAMTHCPQRWRSCWPSETRPASQGLRHRRPHTRRAGCPGNRVGGHSRRHDLEEDLRQRISRLLGRPVAGIEVLEDQSGTTRRTRARLLMADGDVLPVFVKRPSRSPSRPGVCGCAPVESGRGQVLYRAARPGSHRHPHCHGARHSIGAASWWCWRTWPIPVPRFGGLPTRSAPMRPPRCWPRWPPCTGNGGDAH